jgi:hypothetical protein
MKPGKQQARVSLSSITARQTTFLRRQNLVSNIVAHLEVSLVIELLPSGAQMILAWSQKATVAKHMQQKKRWK